jgi:hypothetical protein
MMATSNQPYNTESTNAICVRVPYVNDKKQNKHRNINAHYSGGSGTAIIDAVSGAEMPHRVGSSYEDAYFKIVHTGNRLNATQQGQAVTLFYNTPREYEEHLNESLPENVITAWNTKQMQNNLIAEEHTYVDQFVVVK